MFKLIDRKNWQREQYFSLYAEQMSCAFEVTVELDITKLVTELNKVSYKFYPTMIYLITKTLNNHEHMRLAQDKFGNLGLWEQVYPSFTIFHKDDTSFSNLWLVAQESHEEFCQDYQAMLAKYGNNKGLQARAACPDNIFYISALPWLSFKAFNLHINSPQAYYMPIITMGKYYANAEKILLPFSLRISHATCDGYQVSCFIQDLQQGLENTELWLGR